MTAPLTPAVTRATEILVQLSRTAQQAACTRDLEIAHDGCTEMGPQLEELGELVGALGQYVQAQDDDMRALRDQGLADNRALTWLRGEHARLLRERETLFANLFNALGHVSECYRLVSAPLATDAPTPAIPIDDLTLIRPRPVAAGV